MVEVALEVDERRPLLEDALEVSLVDGLRHFQHVGVALSDVHVVPDPDHVGHEGDHVRRLPDRLAVRHLRRRLVEVLHLEAEEIARRGVAEPGPGGLVPKDRDPQTAVEDPGRQIPLSHRPQDSCDLEHAKEFVLRLFPSEKEVLRVQAPGLSLRELPNHLLNTDLVHAVLLSLFLADLLFHVSRTYGAVRDNFCHRSVRGRGQRSAARPPPERVMSNRAARSRPCPKQRTCES